MSSNIFNALEIDAIGEILNISLGASATAVSTMLGKRVDITTPTVRVLSFDEFEFKALDPAVGVEITYVSGLDGNNIMLLKRSDVRTIVEILMMTEIPEESFELDEMNMSAVCEVMNQMMGASSTALSEFLGEVVNISTPISFEVDNEDNFKRKYFPTDAPMVVVSFVLKIENTIESEFMSVMSIQLAKRLVSAFGISDEDEDEMPMPEEPEASTEMSQSMIDALLGGKEEPESDSAQMSQSMIDSLLNTPNTAPESDNSPMSQSMIDSLMGGGTQTPSPQPQMQQQMQQQMQPQMQQQIQPQMQQQMPPQMQPQMQPQQMMGQPGMYQMPPMYPQPQPLYQMPEPKVINVQNAVHPTLDAKSLGLGTEQAENLALIMSVPLEISVEIGKTRMLVKEILEFTQGSLVVLDKLAGDQVDLYANGQCIAKGDVVVVDDCFGVRITEVIKKPELSLTNKK